MLKMFEQQKIYVIKHGSKYMKKKTEKCFAIFLQTI